MRLRTEIDSNDGLMLSTNCSPSLNKRMGNQNTLFGKTSQLSSEKEIKFDTHQ